MSIESFLVKQKGILSEIGKAGLHMLFPKEYELYVIAIEVVDSKSKTLDYFVFPVLPSTIDISRNEVTNIKKTLSGVSTLLTSSFIPQDISLNGSFGRKLRFLVGQSYEDLIGGFLENKTVTKNSVQNGVRNFLGSSTLKTGYGACKMLERIVEDSKTLDQYGGVKTFIFHNLAFGESYIARPLTIRFNQSQESNMIWNYSLGLKTIAPISAFQDLTSKASSLGPSTVQNTVDTVINKVTGSLLKL